MKLFRSLVERAASLCLLGQRCGVIGPGEILRHVRPQELDAAHPLHCSSVDGLWGMLRVASPEVDHNLFCVPHVQKEIVVFTPLDQLAHPFLVLGFFVVSDEAHYSRFIRKFDDVVGAVGWYAVMS